MLLNIKMWIVDVLIRINVKVNKSHITIKKLNCKK